MKSKLNTFLLLFQDDGKLTDSHIAVHQANIQSSMAESSERVGKHGILFTTNKSSKDVAKKLRVKVPYLLIELTGNIDADTISGFLPNTSIHELKTLKSENIKESAEWLERELNEAIGRQDFEKAAKLRDKIKNTSDGNAESN